MKYTTHSGFEVSISEEDAKLISAHVWYLHRDGYFRSRVAGKWIAMHRLIMGVGPGDGVTEVDHRDGDKCNNRRENLRLCTKSQNAANRRVGPRGSSSRFKGVTWHKARGMWQAAIKVNGRSVYLGLFTSEQAASDAYGEASARAFGDFSATSYDRRTR